MIYRAIIPPDLQQEVWDLDDETRSALTAFMARLRDNPDAKTGTYGHEDTGPERMRQAAIGHVIALFLISDTTGNVTLTRITHLG